MNMTVNLDWEVIEPCPFCGGENVWKNIDPVECGYVYRCQTCGEEIHLCDECEHADDFIGCDWHKLMDENGKTVGGECFRGKTFIKDVERWNQ